MNFFYKCDKKLKPDNACESERINLKKTCLSIGKLRNCTNDETCIFVCFSQSGSSILFNLVPYFWIDYKRELHLSSKAKISHIRLVPNEARTQDFHGGGGGGGKPALKIIVSARRSLREARSPLWSGSRAHLRKPYEF